MTPFTKGLWTSEVAEFEQKRWYNHDGEEKSGKQPVYDSLQSIYSYGRMEFGLCAWILCFCLMCFLLIGPSHPKSLQKISLHPIKDVS